MATKDKKAVKHEKIDVIEFSDDIAPQIMELFDREVVEGDGVVDTHIRAVEKDPYSDKEITLETFGGIVPGSTVFINKGDESLAQFISDYSKR